MEYCGDGVKELSISERQTIANMSIEIGAATGIFPSDERTGEFLKAQRRESDYVPLQPEEGATYDKVVEIDLDRLEPRWWRSPPCRIRCVRPARQKV